MYKAPRGTRDILPQDQVYQMYVEEKAIALCRLYGYERIETPVFEDAQLFIRSIGQGTDIVEKEMYTFADKGGGKLTLKPEGTAPVCRAYLEHGLHNSPQPVKLYYITPTFRYERPQAGRYRQHYQFGYEALGDADPALDAEIIDMAWLFYLSLGLSGFSLQLNSIGCKLCRPRYLEQLREYYTAYNDCLCLDCRARLERSPLRLLDCKNSSCQTLTEAAPKSIDYLCPNCARHFKMLKLYLSNLALPFSVNYRLVRGLDYYTKTVFEIQPEEIGAQTTLGGGGRYDDLIEELGGKPTPAIGFATGIERIILNLKKQEIPIPPLPQPDVFIAYLGSEAKAKATKLASRLRRENIGLIQALGSKSLKAQLRQANSLNTRYTVIIGEEELKEDTVVFRDMVSGEQRVIPTDQLGAELKNMI